MAAPDVRSDLIDAIGDVLRHVPPSDRIGVAVSGGGDSMALLLAAIDWAKRSGAVVSAATVDHGLRAGSAGEARDVAAFCAAHGVPHSTLHAEGLADGSALQARARDHRYRLLRDWASASGIGPILLGHTSDDVAETLLMRLRRGVGLDGLAAMRPLRRVEGVLFLRPFLAISRARLRAELERSGTAWVDDPSNADNRFERAGLRKAMATLDLSTEMLARSARHLDAARSALDAATCDLALRVVEEDRGDLLLTPGIEVGGQPLHPESFRRLVLLALDWIGGGGIPRQAEQDRLLGALPHLVAPITLAGCLISPDARNHRIRIAREAGACAPSIRFGMDGDATAAVTWDRRWQVTGSVIPDATIGALGDDIRNTPWRGTGLPRASLLASPALRRGDTLVAAPLAGLSGPIVAVLDPTFAATLRPA